MTRARLLSTLAAALALWGAACPARDEGVVCRDPVEVTSAFLDVALVSATHDYEVISVDGYAGAAPPGARISVDGTTVTTGFDGRFSLRGERFGDDDSHDIENLTLLVEVGTETEEVTLRMRHVDDALACVVKAPLTTGTTPNAVAAGTCPGLGPSWLVALSGDSVLDVVSDDDGGRPSERAYFAPDDGRPASPWAVATTGDGTRAVVSLQGQDAIAVVAPCAGTIESVFVVEAGNAPLIPVEPSLTLGAPRDVDGDGVADSPVDAMLPRAPQGVAITGDAVLVTFTGYLEPALDGKAPVYGPGVVWRLALTDDGTLVPGAHVVLDHLNPQSVVVDESGIAWVSATGTFGYEAGKISSSSPSALYGLDAETLETVYRIETGAFAPGTPARVDDTLVVGSLLTPALAILPVDATSLDDGDIMSVPGPEVESLFEAVSIGGGLALVPQLSADRVHVVDARAHRVDPPPFVGGIPVGPGGLAFKGPLAIAATGDAPGRSRAAVVLMSAELVRLDLAQVFGP